MVLCARYYKIHFLLFSHLKLVRTSSKVIRLCLEKDRSYLVKFLKTPKQTEKNYLTVLLSNSCVLLRIFGSVISSLHLVVIVVNSTPSFIMHASIV